MITTEQITHYRQRMKSGNEVPVRDLVIRSDDLHEILDTVVTLVHRLNKLDSDSVPAQLRDILKEKGIA